MAGFGGGSSLKKTQNEAAASETGTQISEWKREGGVLDQEAMVHSIERLSYGANGPGLNTLKSTCFISLRHEVVGKMLS